MEDWKETLKKVEEKFNRYRAPEAKAKILSIAKNRVKVKFEGTFCRTCGFYDYFDDFSIFAEDFGLKIKRGKIKENENGAIVEFEKID